MSFRKPCHMPFRDLIPPFTLTAFIHHIWGETVLWGTVFITQCSDRMPYFTILQYKLHSFNIQDDRSTRGLLAKPLKKIPKITYTTGRFSLAQCELWSSVWMNINRVTLQHNKEFVMFIFYLIVSSMCNLQKRLIRAEFWVLLQAMFPERLKTNSTAIKITRATTNNQ